MHRDVQLTAAPIIRPPDLWLAQEDGTGTGAVAEFWGVVRASEQDQPIQGLEYEAFEEMARHQFHLILDHIEKEWPIQAVHVIHRLGPVPAREPSLWVAISAPHRAEAFAAIQHLIDAMKQRVPIWKKPLRNFF